MQSLLANLLARWARWLRPKSAPRALLEQGWTRVASGQSFPPRRTPTPYELLAELKNTAWACASINASVCASYPPRLYVATHDQQPPPLCPAKNLDARTER